jgi:hypothetical protein
MITAVVAKVQIGTTEIDGLMDEDGNFYVGIPQLTDINLVPRRRSAKQLLSLLQLDFDPFVKVKTPLHSKPINALPINYLEPILNGLVFKGSEAALLMQNSLNPTKKLKLKNTPTRRWNEEKVKDRLCIALNGEQEVNTLAGRIDILTKTEVIEVKSFNGWKSAVGQVLVYGHYYPSHRKRIHFFGKTTVACYEVVKCHCDRIQIITTVDNSAVIS